MPVSESQVQAAIVKYLRYQLPKTHRVFAIPNGAQRTPQGYAANAVAGLTRGIPDLCIVGQGQAFFIEVKTETGRLSPEQKEFADWCLLDGLMGWALCRSILDAEKAIRHWKII